MRRARFLAFAFLPLLLVATANAATIRVEARGELTVDENGATAERVDLPGDLLPRLLAAQRDPLLVEGWPVGVGERAAVMLQRFDVYAPDAKIFAVESDGMHEVPRSKLVYLMGTVSGDASARLLVSLDPASSQIRALEIRGKDIVELQAAATKGGGQLLHSLQTDRHDGTPLSWSCGQQATDLDRLLGPSTLPAATSAASGPEKVISLLHTATVAVDTDNELMAIKFANNTTTASTYIANLFAAMNLIYQRDLRVQLLQGMTFLRVAADPYTQPCGAAVTSCITSSAASGNQLNEVSSYWTGACGATCSSIDRAVVMMLSGKQDSNFSASGIASVGTLCNTGSGYSFSQVFKFQQDSSAFDVLITAHEIGHNFGSLHTHCYNPPIDQCFNSEPGCYSGPQVCPAPAVYNGISATGTLMSYCHLSGLSGCNSALVFHPLTVALLAPIVQSKVGQCILLPTGTFEFEDEFEQTGFPAPWSFKSP